MVGGGEAASGSAEPRTAPGTVARAGRPPARDFIREIIAEDLRTGKTGGRVVTRFPPEPNGFLHIGHATSICLNFGIAKDFPGGRCHLRFDDTNPETEEARYVDSMIEDVRWLGFDWGEHLYFASDYFEAMYGFAEELILEGLAYVDSSTEEEIREARGTVTEPGRPTRYRDRGVDENLELFRRMRAGEFPDGAHVLRARIDLASPNMLMRDPILYRIRHAHHYRQGDAWCIYPLYDYAHPIEDALECVTHSICTLEFENNREMYDWVVEHTSVPCRPHQYEFARRNLDYTINSKRKLLRLVNEGYVRGWDDPRMPTIAALRRRGVTPEAIRNFSNMIGIAKAETRVDIGKFEFAVRDDLNQRAPRVLCVLHPLKVVITNYPEGQVEELDAPFWPHDVPKQGFRPLPFGRELFIERDDFKEVPPPGFHRLAPGREVRLRYGYFIRCEEVVKNAVGDVVELRCTYDPATRGGTAPDGRKVRGTIHWVAAAHSLTCEVRLYDRLFAVPDPEAEDVEFTTLLNPESLVVVPDARIEPSVADDPPGSRYQFERLGYFISDVVDSAPGRLVYNRTVTLRDSWTRAAGAGGAPATSGPDRSPDRTKAAVADTAGAPGRNVEARSLPEPTADEVVAAAPSRADRPATHPAEPRVSRAGDEGAEIVAEEIATEVAADAAMDAANALLGPLIHEVLARFPEKVEQYRSGRTGLLDFFVGQVMRQSQGTATPQIVRRLLELRLAA
jgi:glutaminyl-tRNA synthetase